MSEEMKPCPSIWHTIDPDDEGSCPEVRKGAIFDLGEYQIKGYFLNKMIFERGRLFCDVKDIKRYAYIDDILKLE